MGESARFGVAGLREAGPSAVTLRAEWGVPACGHALLTPEKVLLHLEGVRPTFAEPLHGWVISGGAAVGVGRVLAGKVGWVLEGELPDAAAEPEEVWVTAGDAVPDRPVPVLRGALVWVGESAGVSEPGPEPAGVSAQVEMAEPEPEPLAVALAVTEPTVPEAEPEEPGEPMAAAQPRVVTLAAAHPGAPRAAGSAALDLALGGLTLVARGLPAPGALGVDPATGRAYNAYRVWLVGAGGRQRVPAGLCTRVWGDHFRCQITSGLPLPACDTVVVAPTDVGNQQPVLGALRVLEGSV